MTNFINCIFCGKNHKYNARTFYIQCFCKDHCSIEYAFVRQKPHRILFNHIICLSVYYFVTNKLVIVDKNHLQVISSIEISIDNLVESLKDDNFIKNLMVML